MSWLCACLWKLIDLMSCMVVCVAQFVNVDLVMMGCTEGEAGAILWVRGWM